MITVEPGLTGHDFHFVSEDGNVFGFFYPLTKSDPSIWAVSGSYKPLAANVMDFASYDDALAYIVAHAPSKMPKQE